MERRLLAGPPSGIALGIAVVALAIATSASNAVIGASILVAALLCVAIVVWSVLDDKPRSHPRP